ncbi:hypothetical protein TERTU_4473 [Teredinibacter turnerae T7901]|uniref:Uncharacterized protein n=1 Tax=Teredinibacter turnerae (strain ATCC 39867 / T7901) TaxID=377629 RepID=C5BJ62_TERTT|nr:hypothetical protein TERTU_4473 [Teredinibacter turnerae T7901]
MHKTKRSSVGLVAVIVIKAYATSPNYWDQTTLRHIKTTTHFKCAMRTPRKIPNYFQSPTEYEKNDRYQI